MRVGGPNFIQSVAGPENQESGKGLLGRVGREMNAIGASRKSQVRPRVDKDFDGKTLAHFVIADFYNSERKFEQLAGREIFFPNLNKVNAQMHLIANHLKQWMETTDSFAISDVVALHPSTRLIKKTASFIPDEVYSRRWNLEPKAIVSADLYIFRFTHRREHVVFERETNAM
jgi:hypothetical protein